MALEDKIEEKQVDVKQMFEKFKDTKSMYLWGALFGPFTGLQVLAMPIKPLCENTNSTFVNFIEKYVFQYSDAAQYTAVYSMAALCFSVAALGLKRYIEIRKKENEFITHLKYVPNNA